MDKRKIRVGITHGDINGIGYEVILKCFENPEMLQLCTPILYGSPKGAAYHRKVLGLKTPFSIIQNAKEASHDRLSIINSCDDDIKVELGKPDKQAGKAALDALERCIADYKAGLIDVIVTAPINKNTIQSDEFHFPGHTEYIQERLGNDRKALMILMNDQLRVALVTGHVPLHEVPHMITKDNLTEKIKSFAGILNYDFGLDKPRIAVLSLNPHAGDEGLLGQEEEIIMTPVLQDLRKRGYLCYGPFAADGFFGAGNWKHFDGVLAMYHDQGLAPFKVLAMEDGVNYTGGLPVIRTSPAHGTAYEIAGKNQASESSFRSAIYTAIDIARHRREERVLHRDPLQKQFFDKRDDSHTLKLDAPEEGEA